MWPDTIFYSVLAPKNYPSFYLLLAEYMLNIYLMGVLTFYTHRANVVRSPMRDDLLATTLLTTATTAY